MPDSETEIRIGTGPWQGPGPHGPVPIARPGASVYLSLSLSHRAGRGRGTGTRAWIISGTDESLQRDRVRTRFDKMFRFHRFQVGSLKPASFKLGLHKICIKFTKPELRSSSSTP